MTEQIVKRRKSKYGDAEAPGRSASPEYSSWSAMKDRCHSSKCKSFPQYGGRGIKVCERWNDFVNFLADLGPRPDGCTLERIDSTRDYEPGNCVWATRKQQNRNRPSFNRYLTANGERKLLVEWADMLGVKARVISARLRYGWPEEAAATFQRGESWKMGGVRIAGWDKRARKSRES